MSTLARPAAVRVRDAVEQDLPAVAAIYTHYVLKTTVTFNTHVRPPTEWVARFRSDVASGPYDLLVAEDDRAIVGYVQTSRFRPHSAYDRSLETSIYVAPDQGGRGVGSALYGTLFERLAGRAFHRAFAVIALPNDASCRFHERFGFVHRGTLTEAGYKFGTWLDTAYYERALT